MVQCKNCGWLGIRENRGPVITEFHRMPSTYTRLVYYAGIEDFEQTDGKVIHWGKISDKVLRERNCPGFIARCQERSPTALAASAVFSTLSCSICDEAANWGDRTSIELFASGVALWPRELVVIAEAIMTNCAD